MYYQTVISMLPDLHGPLQECAFSPLQALDYVLFQAPSNPFA